MRWWWSPLCTRPTPLVGFFIVLAHNFQVVDNGQYLVEVDVCTALNIAVKHISGVMVSVLVSSVVDQGFEPRLGQNKDL
jgi:hypothetical protein